jgi:hypothetical protein
MSLESYVGLFSAVISLAGLLLVFWQLRQNAKQRESESLVKLYDINRQLLTLGFSHRELFEVLEDKPIADVLAQKRYLQLWLNQLSLSHSFLRRSVVQPELQDELHRNLVDFLGMKLMQKHWEEYGSFYPDSFQQRVNEILKKKEPPRAARAKRK